MAPATNQVVSPGTMLGQYNLISPTLVDGQVGIVQVDELGNLKFASGFRGGNKSLIYVAPGQTQMLGGTGAAGDYLEVLTVVPGTLNPGAVTLTNGSGAEQTIFAGGTNSVSNLWYNPFPIDANSVGGGWKVKTGTNVWVFASGIFTP